MLEDQAKVLWGRIGMGAFARTAFFVLLPALGVGGALGVPVVFCLAGALSLHPSLLTRFWREKPIPILVLIAFLAFAVASCLWSEWGRAEIQAAKIATLALCGLAFASAASRRPRLTLAGGLGACFVLIVLLCIEAFWALPLNRAAQPQILDLGELERNTGRGTSLLLALTWTACATLMARAGAVSKTLGLAVLAGSFFVSTQFEQLANAVAFAAGLAAFGAAALAPRFAIIVTTAGTLLWLWAAPFATPWLLSDPRLLERLPLSWQARAEIWRYVCAHILERPWGGHGIDAGRAHEPVVSVHPHSGSLQAWFDTGLAGVVLLTAALVLGALWFMRRFGKDRWSSAAACGTVASLAVIANISYNLWAEWWFATPFLAAGLIGALATAGESITHPGAQTMRS